MKSRRTEQQRADRLDRLWRWWRDTRERPWRGLTLKSAWTMEVLTRRTEQANPNAEQVARIWDVVIAERAKTTSPRRARRVLWSNVIKGERRIERRREMDGMEPMMHNVFEKRMGRRDLLGRMLQGSMAAAGTVSLIPLLAACGGDDEDPTATAGTDAATATPSMVVEAAPTMAAEATATEPMTEATPTEAEQEPTTAPTQGVEPTEIYGFPIEPAQNVGGTMVRGVFFLWSPYYIIGYDTTGKFESLSNFHPATGEPVPWLAESWEVSDDAQMWTFTLREGVTFHDGRPLRAEDVVFSFQLTNIAAFGSAPITEATLSAPDDQTVVFEFPETAVTVLSVMPYYRVRAKHVLSDIDIETAEFSILTTHPAATGEDPSLVIGTGPFRFVEFVPDVGETVARYENYWGGTPHLDEIVYQQFASADLLIPPLQTGEIDMGGEQYLGLNPAQAGELDPDAVQVVAYDAHQAISFIPNRRPDRPLFQDIEVRQALMHAIDRQALVDPVTFGFGKVAESPLTANWAYDPDGLTVGYAYDPGLAAELLDAAGWVVGNDGIREKNGTRFSFTAIYYASSPYLETAALIVQEFWQAVGVEMAIERVPDERINSEVLAAGDFELLFSVLGTEYAALWYAYSCESFSYAADWWGYCNPDLQVLLDEAQAVLDPDTQRSILTEAVNVILGDVPAGLLVTYPGLNGVSTRLHNVYPNVNDPLFNVQTWWMDA
jgi:peptide/nickel transport system substrate-binding protein